MTTANKIIIGLLAAILLAIVVPAYRNYACEQAARGAAVNAYWESVRLELGR